MKHSLVVLFMLLASVCAAHAQPVPIIFDTDMGNDVDDALALAVLHALESRGEAKLLAVTLTKDNRYAAPYVDLVNTFYGRPDIPIGVVKNGKTPEDSAMIRVPCERKRADGTPVYPRRLNDGSTAPDASTVLRRVLESQPDNSVTIVQVGFFTNMARLLDTDRDLIARKVRLLVVMAGAFPTGIAEYNVKTDLPASRKVFAEWPTPIVASGLEIGNSILYPAVSIERDYRYVENHPIVDAYRAYKKMPYDRQTWDLTAVLYAVRPDRGYFSLSPPGQISTDEKGRTHFTESPGGKHRYLIVNDTQRVRVLEALVQLASQPPK
ncbi:MAG TPA: nucleoside hydrolase [Bryobacteraceae bacterium]|nr:nucleoside hydrolase [Bryobacteraceae bacterium]HOQ45630.1 nucleoside hydrolase [Bryobacteraceae bacterium]HPQ16827.1 nucleoside hydrolase [Bryobacteraceae bacterium]HPU71644.1 nucleoside hydrolase [Bryobacteraceae bacterium]